MKQNGKVIRQSSGIDISMETFDAAIVHLLEDFDIKTVATKKFTNSQKGFESFYQWVEKFKYKDIEINFTMEATGVYYENLACFLNEKDETVHVVLPNKSKKFAESLGLRAKTDKVDAKMLGQMGVERKLRKWSPISPLFLNLRSYTRERESLIQDRTRAKNQLHALNHARASDQKTIKRLEFKIDFLDEQIKQVESDIEELIESDTLLSEKVKKVLTAPGIRLNTLAPIIAETNGFAAIVNVKQLTSFAGYDIRIRESGKWKGKNKISKKGNSHIRAVLFFPACTASVHNKHLKNCHTRIKEAKKIPMVANTAIQRKLLALIFTLWKNDTIYIEDYESSKVA
ncbi:MAG: IS110 family transposase [Salinivirgaceae bacterium]|jgi:transposase|nr:IS110 family transposase [Salinivirgaceae bacterium]